MRFLDRFICKNPKRKQSDHGGSVMQRTTKMAADPNSEILSECLTKHRVWYMHVLNIMYVNKSTGREEGFTLQATLTYNNIM